MGAISTDTAPGLDELLARIERAQDAVDDALVVYNTELERRDVLLAEAVDAGASYGQIRRALRNRLSRPGIIHAIARVG